MINQLLGRDVLKPQLDAGFNQNWRCCFWGKSLYSLRGTARVLHYTEALKFLRLFFMCYILIICFPLFQLFPDPPHPFPNFVFSFSKQKQDPWKSKQQQKSNKTKITKTKPKGPHPSETSTGLQEIQCSLRACPGVCMICPVGEHWWALIFLSPPGVNCE